jgi:hypothetical protein
METSGMRRTLSLLAVLGALLAVPSFPALAQEGTEGSIVVSVQDSSGAVIPGATLTLVAALTNDTRIAQTTGAGTYTFVNLPIGQYRLSVEGKGYETKIYSSVLVESSQATSLEVSLAVGSATQTVQVNSEATPILQTTSNEIGSVIDVKQIDDLPLNGRDLTSLSSLVPGYSGANGEGTFNGLPIMDEASNLDGMVGNSARMKFDANVEPAVSPRLEDIEQMSVQTDQLGLDSGFGQSTTQVTFVTRRGSNQFHGLVYEDFRNDGLNANSWLNDAYGLRKNKLIQNDFGGSVGGPILHNRLFFFGTYAMQKIPGSTTATNDVFTTAAQAGTFTYVGTDGSTHTPNLLTIAQNNGLPSTVNSEVSKAFAAINASLSSGKTATSSDPNYESLGWVQPSPQTLYFPVARLDYDVSQKARMYLSWMMTQTDQPAINVPTFPGSGFANQEAGNRTRNFTGGYGFDYTFSPQLINQFKAGYLYDATAFAYNAAPLYTTEPTVNWNYPGGSGNMSGQTYQLPIDTYYPIWDFSDSMTWQRGKHTIQYGVSWYKEQDHYWNSPGGFYNYNFGLATGDPAINAFTTGSGGTLPDATATELGKAEGLYAILVGRLSGVTGENSYNIKTKQYAQTGTMSEYPLDEVSSAWSLFTEDSWKVIPTLTLNYGLRWDIFGPEKDLTGQYHSADLGAIYGPTAIGALFQPGALNGETNPEIAVHAEPYQPWRVTPQPAFGFVWNPKVESGPLAGLFGGNKTVLRGGWALRRFTEPYQYFWDFGTDYGQFYYQQFNLLANNTGEPGTFSPGSLAIGDTLPSPILSPATYQASAPESEFTYTGGPGVNGIQPNLKEPTSESWNFGIQRQIGHSMALEIRYNGNRTLHQWIAIDPDEINVFENGFLKDFQTAQANLAAYVAANPNCGNSGYAPCSFQGAAGSMPIINAAFGSGDTSDYSNTQYLTYLNTGQVGSFASVLAGINGTVPYFCNLVGAGFSPCANNAGYSGAGAGYPINFFQTNPYSGGYSSGELYSEGYSNYNGLQVDLRQGSWHGLQYDANYTWSHTLGVESANSWTGSFNAFTLRNLRESYGPTVFDIPNVFHANGTYDLPFGKGRTYLAGSRLLDALVGGYTVGTVVTWQGGAPAQLTGEFDTFNDYADGGVHLNGVTPSQLQSGIGVHEVPGQPFADLMSAKYLASPTGGGANTTYIAPNQTPGTIGQVIYLHGPRQYYQDLALTKLFPIHDQMNFSLQASFINVWNHPAFGNADGFGPYVANTSAVAFDSGVQDYGFGEGSPTNEGSGFGRIIELRGNFHF